MSQTRALDKHLSQNHNAPHSLTRTTMSQRNSMNTIRHDIIREIMLWSTSMDLFTALPLTLTVPDQSTFTDDDSISLEIVSKDTETLVDFTFDISCLDGLDDQLLHCPFDAFENICYEEAVRDDPPTPSLSAPFMDTVRVDETIAEQPPSDDSESDSDSCRTYTDDQILSVGYEKDHAAVHPVPELTFKGNTQLFDIPPDDGEVSFIFVDPRITISKPSEAVGFFPMPSPTLPKKSKSNRISAFVATLPGRLVKSSA